MTVRGVTNKQYNQQQLDEQNGYLKGVTIMRWTRNVPVLSRDPQTTISHPKENQHLCFREEYGGRSLKSESAWRGRFYLRQGSFAQLMVLTISDKKT
jgi:hypothetical protein